MGQTQGEKLHEMGGLHVFEDSQAEKGASRVVLVAKDPPAGAGDIRDAGSILGQEDPWKKKWQPTPVFLPGKSHAQRSLTGYSP